MNTKALMQELQTMKRCMDNIVRLIDGAEQPSKPTVIPDDGQPFTDESLMPFGKYAGQKLKWLPADYLNWMMEQPAMKHERLNKWLKAKKQGVKTPIQEFSDPKMAAQVDEQLESATLNDDIPF